MGNVQQLIAECARMGIGIHCSLHTGISNNAGFLFDKTFEKGGQINRHFDHHPLFGLISSLPSTSVALPTRCIGNVALRLKSGHSA